MSKSAEFHPAPSRVMLLIRLLSVVPPFLLGVYPIVFLFSRNIGYYVPSDLTRALLVIIVATMVIWSLTSWRLRSIEKGALAVAIFWVLSFCFGPLQNGLKALGGIAALVSYEPVLFLFWFIVLIACCYLIAKTQRGLRPWLYMFTFVAVYLCILSLIPIVRYYQNRIDPYEAMAARQSTQTTVVDDHKADPNIYFILVDGYPRKDVLKQYLNFDNTAFLHKLQQIGFTVESQSRSNYSQTALSVASIFNMTYLDGLSCTLGPESTDRSPLHHMIMMSTAVRHLRRRGYRTVAFASGFNYTEMSFYQRYLTPPYLMTEFEQGLLDMTPFKVLGDLQANNSYTLRRCAQYFLDHCSEPLQSNGPVFVFAHIFACHKPYIFGRDGGPVEETPTVTMPTQHVLAMVLKQYQHTVVDQIAYINTRLESDMQQAIRESKRPTVILLQADHGIDLPKMPGLSEAGIEKIRMQNFCAYFLPGNGHREVYPTMTPVNLFPVIFNQYFGEHYPLLPDRSYYSSYMQPYNFKREF